MLRNLQKLKDYSFPDKYLCDENGNIFLKHNMHRMKSFVTRDKYTAYKLVQTNGKPKHLDAHRVVAGLFVKRPKDYTIEKYVVNHKNKNRQDNNYKNLEYVTRKDNMLHRYRYKVTTEDYSILEDLKKLENSNVYIEAFNMAYLKELGNWVGNLSKSSVKNGKQIAGKITKEQSDKIMQNMANGKKMISTKTDEFIVGLQGIAKLDGTSINTALNTLKRQLAKIITAAQNFNKAQINLISKYGTNKESILKFKKYSSVVNTKINNINAQALSSMDKYVKLVKDKKLPQAKKEAMNISNNLKNIFTKDPV